MVAKHCVYRDCESDTRYWDRDFMRGVCFIRFPNPKTHRERCQKWVKACGREDLTIDCVNDKTYICSKHFLGGNGPTKESIDPLPPNQLFEANRPTESANRSNIYDIVAESQTNHYFKPIDNSLSLNCNQTNELNLMTNMLNKNQTLINANQINTTKFDNNFSTNHINSSLINSVPNVIDIESSDNSIEFSNELLNESLLLPTIASISPQNTPTTHVFTNEVLNIPPIKTNTEVVNQSLPMIIIPSANNQTINSSFSVPTIPLNDDKCWFKKLVDNEFCLKLNNLDLSLGRRGQRLTFSSIKGSLVEKQLIVDISGHFDVKVFGLSICAKNSFYKSVPILIQNELELNAVLCLFSKWKVCVANDITERVFEDKIIAIRGFVCSITNTIRSKNCELFLPEIGSIRCKSCRILLNRIRKFKNCKQTVDNSVPKQEIVEK